MNSSKIRAIGLVALLLTGCKATGPWPNDRVVDGTSQATTTVRVFRHVQGSDPVESNGVRGTGSACDEAAESTGWTRTQQVVSEKRKYETFGQTPTQHPLQPDQTEYGTTMVSVLTEDIRREGREAVESQDFPLDEDPVSRFEEDPDYVSTNSRFVGIAGIEYLVELFPFDAWTHPNTSDSGGYQFPDLPFLTAAEGDTGGGSYPSRDGAMRIKLLTKRHAATGDVWTSVDHRLVFRAGPVETVVLGDDTEVNARVVEVFSVGGADPNGAGLLSACLNERPATSTELDDPEDLASGLVITERQRVLLDDECTGLFRHQRIGTEWWFDDVLVRSETTTWDVKILDFGYEWYTEDEDNDDVCTRQTSETLPEDVEDAKLFMEYRVTEELSSYVVDAITKAGAEDAGKGKRNDG